MQDLRADHRNFPEQEPFTITVADVQQWIKNMNSWTAPGSDMIHHYWLKHLTAVHERLAAQMNQLLASGSHSDWLTQGRMVLVMKDLHKVCICMYKYYSTAQKRIGNNTRGSKHQLLIVRAVTNDSRSRPTNLSTALIDYRKACDSRPHTWIWECLALYNVSHFPNVNHHLYPFSTFPCSFHFC